MTNKKPTRTDLLRVVFRLRALIHSASSAISDRNPNRAAHVEAALKAASHLCNEATCYDSYSQCKPNGKGWGDNSKDIEWKKTI